MATYYHCFSSDDEPRHNLCPPGENSWCFVQKAISQGAQPQSHSKMKISFHLDNALRKHILAVYIDLSIPELLQKCLKSRTQNTNESTHARIWQKCPQTKFCGKRRLIFAVAQTVLEYNIGHEGTYFLADFGCSVGKYARKRLNLLEKHRVRQRSKSKQARKKLQPCNLDYGPGEF